MKSLSPPALAMPSVYYGQYMDIAGAYWNIYRRLHWGVDFDPSGRWFGIDKGTIHLSEYPYHQHKLARNALIGICVSQSVVIWTEGQPHSEPRQSGLWNPALAAICWVVLSDIARFARDELGARYYNLDGAIIPDGAQDLFSWWVDDTYGLYARPKSGTGWAEVVGVGCYRVGETTTLTWGAMKPSSSSRLAPEPWCRWLRQKWSDLTL